MCKPLNDPTNPRTLWNNRGRALGLTAGIIALVAVASPGPALSAGQPLWGYGVRTCAEFLRADDAELRRYEDWLTGFLSGLNLATGEDVLRGADLDAALAANGDFCATRPTSDFFNATMALVRERARRR